jgi:hypothetical protein
LKNLHKKLPQQAQKRLKNRQNVVRNIKNKTLFKDQFLKRTFSTVSTACITGAGAGVDSAWEQEELEARKILEIAAESPAFSARCVGPR